MKIIKEGDLRRTLPWFCVRPITCPKCGCQFQFEESDKPHAWNDQFDGHGGNYPCPTCKKTVYFYDADMRGIAE